MTNGERIKSLDRELKVTLEMAKFYKGKYEVERLACEALADKIDVLTANRA